MNQHSKLFIALDDLVFSSGPAKRGTLAGQTQSSPSGFDTRQRIAQFSRDTIMSGHTLVGLIALGTFGLVMLMAGAVFF